MTGHQCGIGISSIFDKVFRFFGIFRYGIAALNTPQCLPQLIVDDSLKLLHNSLDISENFHLTLNNYCFFSYCF